MRKHRTSRIQGAINMSASPNTTAMAAPLIATATSAPLALPASSTVRATPAVPAPPAVPATPILIDVNTEIQAVFQARKQIPLALTALESRRRDLGRTIALAYSSDVAANGVDPATAVTRHDDWHTKDTQFSTQQGALMELLGLIEARIEEFKHTNPDIVSAVLRDQIVALSENLSNQEKTEHSTERQLKLLWDELRDVDPGCFANMAKGGSLRAHSAESKKSGNDSPKLIHKRIAPKKVARKK